MVKQERFRYLSKDGRTKIHGVKWVPDCEIYRGVLQITHGMIEFIERYDGFARYIAEQGFLVVGNDNLGHGESVSDKKEWGYFAEKNSSDILVADMHTLRKKMQSDNPGVPYYMFGHSMGSYLLRKYITKHGEDLAGAIICGTGSVPDVLTRTGMGMCKIMAQFKGWHHRSKLIEAMSFSGPYKKYDMTGKDPANSWLTKDQEIVKRYYNEPKCSFTFTLNGYKALFDTVYYDNQKENIAKMPKDLPIFMISGKDDPVGDCGVGVRRVYDMFIRSGMNDVTCKLYENDRHEILNETDRDKIYSDILNWINSKS